MSVIRTLKRLAGLGPSDVEAATTALSEVEGEFARAISEFESANASFGARLVEAMADGDPAKVEADLAAKSLRVERLRHARDAVAKRLQEAQEAAKGDEADRAWDRAAEALRKRQEALKAFDGAMRAAGDALLAAEGASEAAYQAIPQAHRSGAPDRGPAFTRLDAEALALMSMATDGRAGPFYGSRLWDIRQRPSLLARAAADEAKWLALRPSRDEPPEAA